jgi:hypothetical protein
MKLELKSFKFFPTMSEETNAFSANLYFDGKLVADCKNDGFGGSTFIRPLPNGRKLFEKAEEYAKTLPSIQVLGMDLEMDLENWVDIEVERLIEETEFKKHSNKGLCIGNGDKWGGQMVTWSGYNIKKLLSDKRGVEILSKAIEKYISKGYKIFNTNIPKNILEGNLEKSI